MTSIVLRGHELYVRVDGRTAAAAHVRGVLDQATEVHHEPGAPYCVVLWAAEDFRPPEHLFEVLSRELATEVIWLAWQKQVDAFAFQRWVGGRPVRRLSYGVLDKERTWELVEGTPEPWEAEALFPPTRLERQLRVRRLLADDSMPEAELRRIWEQRLLVVDSEHPQLVAIDAAHVVARHFQLPGWTA
jgi:hypothetical protein